jgi:hypothetical protein
MASPTPTFTSDAGNRGSRRWLWCYVTPDLQCITVMHAKNYSFISLTGIEMFFAKVGTVTFLWLIETEGINGHQPHTWS